MATATLAPAEPRPPAEQRRQTTRAVATLALRWLLLVGSTALAFHRCVATVGTDLAYGTGLQYLLAVPVYALVAAVWTHHRAARSLDIHDRETDVIVGLLSCGFAVLSATLLGRPLSGVYFLWRIDLLMMCVFAFGASVVLFGLRRTLYYRWAWVVLLLGWPLLGRVLLYTVGDGRAVTLALLHLGVLVAVPIVLRRPGDRWWWVAPLLSAAAGLAVLPVLDLVEHPGRIAVPALTASVAGLAVLAVRSARARRTTARSWLAHPHVQSPVVRRPWGAVAVLVAITLLGAVAIPGPPAEVVPVPISVAAGATGPGSVIPPGWRQTGVADYPEAAELFGSGAQWRRYQLEATADASQPGAVDALDRRRTVVLDVLSTRRPRNLVTFPTVVTYPMGRLNLSGDEQVPIGSGVTASVDAAVDTQRQLTWTMVSFEITLPGRYAVADGQLTTEPQVWQRITLISVDDHEPGAPFPEPTNALLDSVRSAAVHIVRGSAGGAGGAAEPKDRALLLTLAEQILSQRAAGSR